MSTEPIFSAEPVPPQSGMSGGARLILGIGAGCFTALVLACGGLAYFAWDFGKQVASSEDPVVIQQDTAKIVQINVPAGLEPKFSLSTPVPFTKKAISMSIYTDKEKKALLTVMQVSGEMADEAQLKQMQTQMESQMNAENSRAREVEIDPASVKQHPAEIHGEAAKFTISTGKDKEGKEVRIVDGTFKGAGGAAVLYFLGDAEAFSEQALEEMIDSMK
jgi:hypothetical protein